MKRFEDLTEDDLNILRDTSLSGKEIQEIFDCGPSTPHRWRKKLGVKVTIGSKKGKEKPENRNGEMKPCPVCGKEFYQPKYHLERDLDRCCSRECLSQYDEYRLKLSTSIKEGWVEPSEARLVSIEQRRKPETPEYTRYKNLVHRLSEKVYQENKHIINPNDYPRTLAGVDGGWQLDHIIEVRFGFDNDIPAEVLCEVDNLRMLPWQKNLARNKKK